MAMTEQQGVGLVQSVTAFEHGSGQRSGGKAYRGSDDSLKGRTKFHEQGRKGTLAWERARTVRPSRAEVTGPSLHRPWPASLGGWAQSSALNGVRLLQAKRGMRNRRVLRVSSIDSGE